MIDAVTLVGDLYFPMKDEHIGKIPKNILTTDLIGPRYVSNFCKNKKVVVQAGGNCGIYPKIYSEIFQVVYTFEPDPINFFCLVQNTKFSNVIKFQSCLGFNHGLVSLEIDKNVIAKKGYNCGTFQVSGSGNIPTFRIDDLSLIECDLIHLDIEGFEGIALEGAIETIKKLRPVICLEINGLGKKYGWDQSRIYSFLSNLNYKFKEITESDHIFLP